MRLLTQIRIQENSSCLKNISETGVYSKSSPKIPPREKKHKIEYGNSGSGLEVMNVGSSLFARDSARITRLLLKVIVITETV